MFLCSLEKIIVLERASDFGYSIFDKCPNLTIYGKENTSIDNFCEENGYNFVSFGNVDYTSDDLVQLRKDVVGILTVDELDEMLFDADLNNILGIDDLILMRKKIAGLT